MLKSLKTTAKFSLLLRLEAPIVHVLECTVATGMALNSLTPLTV